ncbi:MAG: ATP-binding protein [Alteromonas sp.]|jgi:two-component system sensor histidine kinase PhoQ|uniref:ATP-binding protein n=1 Tax=unclassified Alteromonas TaxID=2614992 RepID=UPI0009039206|nr:MULTISPECIES: ATP-binding protein [unclassified Alteromonas]APE05676.1 ATP-binding protein [Alteromonas sp. RW2A1]AUC87893.1 ATP-binding protein [Alteromonas sp. MB-3u-76]MAI63914.1 ATP-binding protein [Alteromonas sp.]
MRQLSLRVRSVLLAFTLLALFAPFTVIILEEAFTESLTEAKMSELRLMNLSLLTAFELEGDSPVMPEVLFEEELNLPGSGYLGLIVFRNEVIWQSASALEYVFTPPNMDVPVGNEVFSDDYTPKFDIDSNFFVYAFTAEFLSSQDFEPVHFYIFNNKAVFEKERQTFLATTWQWIITLSAALLIFIIVGISLILLPVKKIIDEISLASKGKKSALNNRYPVEFDSLKHSINELLHFEATQRKRYKNSLGDLAHSLKTPLAVALGSKNLQPEIKESLTQIDNIIQRQLKRASAGKTGWQAAIPVEPVLLKIADAMDKIYQDKNLSIECECSHSPNSQTIAFKGDETDLLELCGNLLDNACKAAVSRVCVSASIESEWLIITIEDDGPGIVDGKKQELLERGARLDTYAEGQGIGLALVSDLVSIYEGKMHIENSHLGGARVVVKFPNH